MTAQVFPDAVATRPLWLITLADLSLLLVGFFVLMQANQKVDGAKLADGFRAGFGIERPAASAPMPVAIAAIDGFAVGSADLPSDPGHVIAWAREMTRDPRVTLRLMGYTDAGAADVDEATGSAALLAADRARALATALVAADVARDRFSIETAAAPGRRQVVVTLGFAGERTQQ